MPSILGDPANTAVLFTAGDDSATIAVAINTAVDTAVASGALPTNVVANVSGDIVQLDVNLADELDVSDTPGRLRS